MGYIRLFYENGQTEAMACEDMIHYLQKMRSFGKDPVNYVEGASQKLVTILFFLQFVWAKAIPLSV